MKKKCIFAVEIINNTYDQNVTIFILEKYRKLFSNT
jgi:hypothetical protein